MLKRLRVRPEWQFFAALPKADPLLALAWWALLAVSGVMPAVFAVAIGVTVGAVQQDGPVGAPLALTGAVFVIMLAATPILTAVSMNLGNRLSALLNERLIRACVERDDGTSNLILQGLQRVRFASFEQEKPFPIARINAVESRDETTVETEALGTKVLEFYANLKHDGRQLPAKLDRYLAELRDLEMLADLMASTFVNDPLRRQRVLEEQSINQRLRFLIRFLRDEIGNAAA